MNNLRKFNNEAEYSAATLNYPAVSWVVSGDTMHYDKSAPVVYDKVMIASYDGKGESDFNFFNCESSSSGDIESIIYDDVTLSQIECQGEYGDSEQTHIAEYALTGTTVGDWCSGELGMSSASDPAKVDCLIPAQITSISNMPNNAYNWVIEATTPPYIDAIGSAFGYHGYIYVPDSVVNTYKEDSIWSEVGDSIKPISEYNGVLPV